jgi:N-acetyl sugar amidotransferase
MTENRVCARCVMDISATNIQFDAAGVCNYCRYIQKIKDDGKGKEYDCIVGVSGGVDSSYVLYLAIRNGLRPLAVHLDNGWNSELASHNITSLVTHLNVDLYTHVIDWSENRDLQLSFFKANAVDIELLMDNAMLALNYQQAARFGVRHILSGANLATEGIRLPEGWAQYKRDVRNIRAIHRRFGKLPIKTHPLLSTLQHAWYEIVRRICWESILDLVEYNKAEALAILQREVGYKPYPYKHYESVFTRFYQAYILPRKFGFDKRRMHLSTLIVSGQMKREEALKLLESPSYPDARQQEQDRVFVMKKLGFTEQTFDEYLRAPPVPHAVYGSEWPMYRALMKIHKFVGGR